MAGKVKEKTVQTIGVVGLGYVGLPVAISFSRKHHVIGYDIDIEKIDQLRNGEDPTEQFDKETLQMDSIEYTTNPKNLKACDIIIVTVPTPLTKTKEPDLTLLKKATQTIGQHMKTGAIIIFESTVYPGVTEEICIPILNKASGFHAGVDFHVGYSPERINPGDEKNQFTNIPKVVSGMNYYTRANIAQLYRSVIDAEIYEAPSIKIAEAAKILENTQRDINIALMNEFATICKGLHIETEEVIKAAATKWNFTPFTPGLVGGHCIGVDPYYLIYEAERHGVDAKFIKSARLVNDRMPEFIVQQVMESIISRKLNLRKTRIHLIGVTFKENVGDMRNSKALEILEQLKDLGIEVKVCDPHANQQTMREQYNSEVKREIRELPKADIAIIAVPHDKLNFRELPKALKKHAIIFDLKSVLSESNNQLNGRTIWKL